MSKGPSREQAEAIDGVSTDLRQRVLRSGVFLVGRQVIGMLVSLGGIFAVTRLIGPTDYGSYAGALAIVGFLVLVGRLGVDVFLVRREDDPDLDVYHQASTILGTWGIALALAGTLAGPLLVGQLIDHRLVSPLIALLPTVPVTLITAPALAHLDRALNFRAVAFLELGCQASTVGVMAVLAMAGAGIWAPIAGYWAGQIYQLVRSHSVANYRPRLVWSPVLVREMIEYGLGCSASTWIWHARPLIIALVVGRFLGPEGVAFVALATRLVDVLTFVKTVAWRLSIAALAKVQGNVDRLRRGMEEAMTLQVMGVGPLLGGFALVAPWLLPALFGPAWDPALAVFPFIALGYLVNSAFSLQSSVLYVLRRNRSVAAHNAIHLALLSGALLLLIPPFGLWGYALAEVVALGSYIVIHRKVASLFAFSYAQSAPWLVAFGPPLFVVFVPTPWKVMLWFPVLVVAFWPRQRRLLGGYARQVRWRVA